MTIKVSMKVNGKAASADVEARTLLNVVIVMGLGGLWHGASWNFAAWGLYHGVLLVLHRLWRRWVVRRGLAGFVDRAALRPLWIALTFMLVTLGWIPFRAPDFASTWATLQACATPPDLVRSPPAAPGLSPP